MSLDVVLNCYTLQNDNKNLTIANR